MSYAHPGQRALDYLQCRYGKSKLLFRGPRKKLTGDFVAFLGGTETYGKFVEQPFPDLVQSSIGTPCVNFGYTNAGVDVFLNEPTLIEAGQNAKATVIQLVGAQNMSNRFYAVHPRRNDRFLRASALLKTIFREVDFTDFNFNRAMLLALHRTSPEKYDMVLEELRSAWCARMELLLDTIGGKIVMLWIRDNRVEQGLMEGSDLGPEPLFVTEEMVAQFASRVAEVVEVNPSEAALAAGTDGMVFDELDAAAALQMYGPKVHAEIADGVGQALARVM